MNSLKKKQLNQALSALYLEVDESIAKEVTDKVVAALNEAEGKGTEVTKRILTLLRDQFKYYYQGFTGTFEEWLEVRGLGFQEDRFTLVNELHRQAGN